MNFVIGTKELLKKSKFYDKDKCWDYPLEELEYVLQQRNPDHDMVYVVCQDKRLYETVCNRNNLKDLYSDLKQDMVLRSFEMASVSLYIKLYTKAGEKIANKRFQEWEQEMKDSNPNTQEILRQAKIVIEPLKNKRTLRHTLNFDFSYINKQVFDYCNQHIDIAKEFIDQFKEYIDQLENQDELEEE